MGTRQMTPFFSFTFAALTILSFLNFKILKIYISRGLRFGPFWSVKYLNFCPKATDMYSSSYISRK